MADSVLDEILGWFKPKPNPPRDRSAAGEGLFANLPTNNNLSNWAAAGTRNRELQETQLAWNDTEALWRRSPLGQEDFTELVMPIVRDAEIVRTVSGLKHLR